MGHMWGVRKHSGVPVRLCVAYKNDLESVCSVGNPSNLLVGECGSELDRTDDCLVVSIAWDLAEGCCWCCRLLLSVSVSTTFLFVLLDVEAFFVCATNLCTSLSPPPSCLKTSFLFV